MCIRDRLSNIEESDIEKVSKKYMNNLETVSLKLAKNIISYLSRYNLQSYKYLNYIYFYKIYLLKKNKLSFRELSNDEIEKSLLKIKEYISRMR